jgi:hypothetical protein
MRKIRAERPSNPQQNDLGMESNASIAWDPATLTGAGFDRTVIRAVSLFGPGWTGTPAKFSDAAGASAGERKFFVVPASDETGVATAGLGKGCRTGEAVPFGENTGGQCDERTGGPALTGDGWMTDGGDRPGEMAGVRDGRAIGAKSCFAPSFWRPGVISGLWGSSLRTVSFFGSAMTDHVAPRKIAENSFIVTLTFRELIFSRSIARPPRRMLAFTPVNRNLDCL